MANIERIGVSLDEKLLAGFDKMIAAKGYENRSEAIRDLIRTQLHSEKLEHPDTEAVAAVLLAYDHHVTNLNKKLNELQHSQLLKTISSLHVHLDEHNCLEVILLRGKVGEINKMAEKLISLKGVRLGHINLIGTHEHQSAGQ
ncbi:MAG: nickel-responsive transcriptional regulator NikR [Phycisphaerae bacterium]|nr:nickel-responsive transcriptional regulator NikR [Phycisphaerae bacterium]